METTLPADSAATTTAALRGASAAAICLVLAEWLQLSQPGLAVWSTHMVMVQYTFTSFQKGVERALGRGLGIFAAIIIATLTRNAPTVGLALEMLAVVPLFYCFFCNRLSYTFLNAGLYLASMMQLARVHPSEVISTGGALFNAVVLGVAVAVGISWLSRAESDITIHTEGDRLWPVDRPRMLHSIVLAITVGLVHLVCYLVDMSPTSAMVSVMVLTIAPDYQSLIHKGELRLAGAGLAVVFASVTLLLLVRRPSLPLLVIAVFLGIFIAIKVARSSTKWGYASLQMGLVLPMILVVPEPEFGSLTTAFSRIAGVLLAIAVSIGVGVVWAAIGPAPPIPLTPVSVSVEPPKH